MGLVAAVFRAGEFADLEAETEAEAVAADGGTGDAPPVMGDPLGILNLGTARLTSTLTDQTHKIVFEYTLKKHMRVVCGGVCYCVCD